MKRVILILAVVAFALVLWDRLSTRKSPTEKARLESSSKTNVISTRIAARRSSSGARSESDSTNSVLASDDEGPEWKKLSREQVEAYLLKTKRSPESLLNAFIETGDTNFLAEAAEKYSDNPVVQWAMVNQKNSPEERRQWLEKLKASSPDNALPNYLSALDKLKAGNTEQALTEIDAASKKVAVSAFEHERMQSREKMYLLAGYSPLEAKTQSLMTLLLPNLSEMKSLAQELYSLQQKYRAAGDNSSAQQLAAVGIEIGGKVAGEKSSPTLITQMVGYAMENIALKGLDAGSYYDFIGKTASERIEELKHQKEETRELQKTFIKLFSNLTETEMLIYSDRLKLYGELNAMRWLNKNYGSETK